MENHPCGHGTRGPLRSKIAPLFLPGQPSVASGCRNLCEHFLIDARGLALARPWAVADGPKGRSEPFPGWFLAAVSEEPGYGVL